MKMVKNIAIVAFATCFMFAGVGFHYANNYTGMDSGTTVSTSWGVTYDLNDNSSVGWDSDMGMMMYFDAPAGVSLRLGWAAEIDVAAAADVRVSAPALVDHVDAALEVIVIGLPANVAPVVPSCVNVKSFPAPKLKTAESLNNLISLPKIQSLATDKPPSVCNEPSVVFVASVLSSTIILPDVVS